MDETQVKRVRDELKAVGVGSIGLRTPESKGLARILHADEHIGGVVYGRYSGGLAWLIATDQRVIFLDRKPFYTTTDELTYDVVSGVQSTHAGPFVSVVLHTRLGDYAVRFVNTKCAGIFVHYIEKRRLESDSSNQVITTRRRSSDLPALDLPVLSDEALIFLRKHDLAVLSTIDRTGNVYGAVVYYVVGPNGFVYVLTKSDTGKGRNVYAHSQVALTVHEAGTVQTVQLQGTAQVETDQPTRDEIFTQMIKPRAYREGPQMPPVTKLHEGSFMIVKISPTFISFHDYSKLE